MEVIEINVNHIEDLEHIACGKKTIHLVKTNRHKKKNGNKIKSAMITLKYRCSNCKRIVKDSEVY